MRLAFLLAILLRALPAAHAAAAREREREPRLIGWLGEVPRPQYAVTSSVSGAGGEGGGGGRAEFPQVAFTNSKPRTMNPKP